MGPGEEKQTSRNNLSAFSEETAWSTYEREVTIKGSALGYLNIITGDETELCYSDVADESVTRFSVYFEDSSFFQNEAVISEIEQDLKLLHTLNDIGTVHAAGVDHPAAGTGAGIEMNIDEETKQDEEVKVKTEKRRETLDALAAGTIRRRMPNR